MLTGKGLWLWQLSACGDEDDPWPLMSRLLPLGLSHLVVKVTDGAKPYNDTATLQRLVRACHMEHIAVWGFGYTYGASEEHAALEGNELGARCKGLELDGAVIDAESEYETANSSAWAQSYCQAVKSAFAGPLALSSFWKPSVHAAFPWDAFCASVDVLMPQVYWGDRDAAFTLRESAAEFAPYLKVYPHLQFFPTGAIDQEEGGGNPLKVTHFCAEVDAEGWAGANMWDLQEEVPSMLAAFAAWKPGSGSV